MKELIKLIEQNEPFSSLSSGCHGKRHARNVLDFALKLSEFFDVDKQVIVLSALLHDTGRVNDCDDPEHGERGALIVKEFIKFHKLNVDASLVARCIKGHVKEFNTEIECKIIGDADKLDRYRFSGQDRLKVEFLELTESYTLIEYAKRVNEL